jgi:VWFA-related protein
MRVRIFGLFLTLFSSAVAVQFFPVRALAQDDEGVLRVDTQLVLVDVVAVDDDGSVADLSQDDFTLLDEGTEQNISVFEVTRRDGSSRSDAAPLPPGVVSNMRDWQGTLPGATTIVLIDRLNTPDQDQVALNLHLQEFFSDFDDVDHLALYELTDELTLLHDYTANPDEIEGLVANLKPFHSVTLASSSDASGFEAPLGTVGVDRDLGDFLGGTTGRGQFGRQSADFFLDSRIQTTLEALETIIYHVAGLPGRKNIVWLSGRFPFTFDPWNRTDLVEEIERSTVSWMESVGFLMTRMNVAVYPVDVRGPNSEGDAEFNGVMQTIAQTTGGRPFYGTNAGGDAIAQAVADSRVVYTLGFYPSERGENGKFRDVDVRVDRRGVQLQHRPGYFAFSGSQSTDLTWGLSEFLTAPLDATEITLVATARTPAAGAPGYQLVVLADTADLNLVPEGEMHVGEYDFIVVFESAQTGALSILPAETIPIALSQAQYEQALQTGFPIQKTLATDGNTGRARVVIRDRRTGAAGSLWVPVGVAGPSGAE